MKKIILISLTACLASGSLLFCAEQRLMLSHMQKIRTPLGVEKDFDFMRPMRSLLGEPFSAVELYRSTQATCGSVIIAAAKVKERSEIIFAPLMYLAPANLENIHDPASTYYYQIVNVDGVLALIDVTMPTTNFLSQHPAELLSSVGYDLLMGNPLALNTYNWHLNSGYQQHVMLNQQQVLMTQVVVEPLQEVQLQPKLVVMPEEIITPSTVTLEVIQEQVNQEVLVDRAPIDKEKRALLKKIAADLETQTIFDYVDQVGTEIAKEVIAEAHEEAEQVKFKKQEIKDQRALEQATLAAQVEQDIKKKKRVRHKKKSGQKSENNVLDIDEDDDFDLLLEEAKQHGEGAFNQTVEPSAPAKPRTTLKDIKAQARQADEETVKNILQNPEIKKLADTLWLDNKDVEEALKQYGILKLTEEMAIGKNKEAEKESRLDDISKIEAKSFCEDEAFKKVFFDIFRKYGVDNVEVRYYLESKDFVRLMPDDLSLIMVKTTDCFVDLSDDMCRKNRDRSFDLDSSITKFIADMKALKRELIFLPPYEPGLGEAIKSFNSVKMMMNKAFDSILSYRVNEE